MIDADVSISRTETDESSKTMTTHFQIVLKNDGKPQGELSWPVVLDLALLRGPLPDTPTQQQRQLAFAFLEVQLAAIRQKVRNDPDYEPSTVAMYKNALATQDAEQLPKT